MSLPVFGRSLNMPRALRSSTSISGFENQRRGLLGRCTTSDMELISSQFPHPELSSVALPSEHTKEEEELSFLDDTEEGLRRVFKEPGERPLLNRTLSFLRHERDRILCTPRKVYAHVPMLHWLPRYTKALLKSDLAAGLNVGVVLIPQGMAYAMLADLPEIYGLYSALLPLPIYAALGTSNHVSVGPFALVSLLVADSIAVAGYAPEDEDYIPAVMMLSLLIGIAHCLMAALHLGSLVRYLSDALMASDGL